MGSNDEPTGIPVASLATHSMDADAAELDDWRSFFGVLINFPPAALSGTEVLGCTLMMGLAAAAGGSLAAAAVILWGHCFWIMMVGV
jgi:hypothetical protein